MRTRTRGKSCFVWVRRSDRSPDGVKQFARRVRAAQHGGRCRVAIRIDAPIVSCACCGWLLGPAAICAVDGGLRRSFPYNAAIHADVARLVAWLKPRYIELLPGGWTSETYSVDDAWIVQIGRTSDAANTLCHQVRALPKLAQYLADKIPRPQQVGDRPRVVAARPTCDRSAHTRGLRRPPRRSLPHARSPRVGNHAVEQR